MMPLETQRFHKPGRSLSAKADICATWDLAGLARACRLDQFEARPLLCACNIVPGGLRVESEVGRRRRERGNARGRGGAAGDAARGRGARRRPDGCRGYRGVPPPPGQPGLSTPLRESGWASPAVGVSETPRLPWRPLGPSARPLGGRRGQHNVCADRPLCRTQDGRGEVRPTCCTREWEGGEREREIQKGNYGGRGRGRGSRPPGVAAKSLAAAAVAGRGQTSRRRRVACTASGRLLWHGARPERLCGSVRANAQRAADSGGAGPGRGCFWGCSL